MLLNCPCCHAPFAIEQLTQDEAARELLRLRPIMLPSMIPYVAMFRTGKRMLAFDKALTLVKETSALCDDPGRLEAALSATVESMRAKREEGLFKPLKNHNYLIKVLADTPAGQLRCSSRELAAPPAGQVSKTARGIGRLMDRKSR